MTCMPEEHSPEQKEHEVQHKADVPIKGRHMSERAGVVLFALLGAAVGFVSFLVNQPLQSLALALVVFALSYLVLKKRFKLGEPTGWWTNKVIVYVFIWMAVWTVLYNAYIVRAL